MLIFFAFLSLLKTRLTICEGHDGTETSNGDVLIFPDMIRYRSIFSKIYITFGTCIFTLHIYGLILLKIVIQEIDTF